MKNSIKDANRDSDYPEEDGEERIAKVRMTNLRRFLHLRLDHADSPLWMPFACYNFLDYRSQISPLTEYDFR